jgi:anaerobic dimethyl sulfoxide reductase subunit B (iron-sulfur subunit)
MARYGLLIHYDYCTGCHTCEVACQQEHGHPAGINGIRITKHVYRAGEKVKIDFIPYPTDHCDLCMVRCARGEKPSCVKHCQSRCMKFGPLEELAEIARGMSRVVQYTHRPTKI